MAERITLNNSLSGVLYNRNTIMENTEQGNDVSDPTVGDSSVQALAMKEMQDRSSQGI
jgi:hypothetical protein